MPSFSKTLGRLGTKLGAVGNRLMYGENIHHGFFHSNGLNNMGLYTLIKK